MLLPLLRSRCRELESDSVVRVEIGVGILEILKTGVRVRVSILKILGVGVGS